VQRGASGSCVRGFEVAAGVVGLGLVATRGSGALVLFDGLVALVEEVEHLAGGELGAAANPVAALGLGGGVEVVLRGVGDEVLSALGFGEAEVGHLEAGVGKVAGLGGVGEYALVGSDGGGSVAFVFGEIGFFEAEEIVARVFLGEAVHDSEGLSIAGVVTEEESERGAALDAVDGAFGGALSEKVETFFFVTGDAGDADHDAEEARERGDGELLDADGHFCVGVVGVEAEGLFAVLAGGESLTRRGVIAVKGKSEEGRVHALGVAASEVGVRVVGVLLDLLVAHGNDRIGELVDALVRGFGDEDVALGEYEGVVGVVGGVEEVLMVELAEDEGHQDVVSGHGVLGIGALDGLEAGESAIVVEVVEEVVGFADIGCEVYGVGVRVGRVGEKRCGQSEEQEKQGKEEGEIPSRS